MAHRAWVLPVPGSPKADVHAALDEAALGQLVQLLAQGQRHPVVLEGFPGVKGDGKTYHWAVDVQRNGPS